LVLEEPEEEKGEDEEVEIVEKINDRPLETAKILLLDAL
jgi:hypothetical protein